MSDQPADSFLVHHKRPKCEICRTKVSQAQQWNKMLEEQGEQTGKFCSGCMYEKEWSEFNRVTPKQFDAKCKVCRNSHNALVAAHKREQKKGLRTQEQVQNKKRPRTQEQAQNMRERQRQEAELLQLQKHYELEELRLFHMQQHNHYNQKDLHQHQHHLSEQDVSHRQLHGLYMAGERTVAPTVSTLPPTKKAGRPVRPSQRIT
jgi:hypothetical protein